MEELLDNLDKFANNNSIFMKGLKFFVIAVICIIAICEANSQTKYKEIIRAGIVYTDSFLKCHELHNLEYRLLRISIKSIDTTTKKMEFIIDFVLNDFEVDSYPVYYPYIYKDGHELFLLRMKEYDLKFVFNENEIEEFEYEKRRKYPLKLCKTSEIVNGKIRNTNWIHYRPYLFNFSYEKNKLLCSIQLRY